MHRGGMLAATVAILSLTACLGDKGKLEIRSVDNGFKARNEPVSARVADAYGQLAIGNVALALEGFRTASREDAASVDAFAGMAQCYDKMGRFDLSRRYYEQALAVSPRNATVLALFSNSLDMQGLRSEAASVRAELASLASPAQAPVLKAAAAPAPAPAVTGPVGKSVTIALAPPPVPAPVKAAPVPAAVTEANSASPAPVAPVGKSVTIALAPLPPGPKAAPSRGPRIERLSLTEVALITGDGPKWQRPEMLQPVRMAAKAPQQREQMAALPVRLRVLNAARIDKLAARTRTYLGQFGWRQVLVGDAAAVRPKSLILYPQAARAEAARLSSRFGFPMAPRADVRQLTILLGRDAAAHPALRAAP